MPSDGSALVKLLVYIPALVMGVYLVFGVIRLIRNKRAEPVTVSAQVQDKRYSRVKPMNDKVYHPRKQKYNHYVSFRTEDGKCMEFLVSEEEYCRLEEGKTGTLTFRAYQYICFE